MSPQIGSGIGWGGGDRNVGGGFRGNRHTWQEEVALTIGAGKWARTHPALRGCLLHEGCVSRSAGDQRSVCEAGFLGGVCRATALCSAPSYPLLCDTRSSLPQRCVCVFQHTGVCRVPASCHTVLCVKLSATVCVIPHTGVCQVSLAFHTVLCQVVRNGACLLTKWRVSTFSTLSHCVVSSFAPNGVCLPTGRSPCALRGVSIESHHSSKPASLLTRSYQ